MDNLKSTILPQKCDLLKFSNLLTKNLPPVATVLIVKDQSALRVEPTILLLIGLLFPDAMNV